MRRVRIDVEGDLFHATLLAKRVSVSGGTRPHVKGTTPLQVGKREGGLAVATVGGPDQVEESVVLGDGHQLAGAHRPAYGRETKTDQSAFADEGRTHP